MALGVPLGRGSTVPALATLKAGEGRVGGSTGGSSRPLLPGPALQLEVEPGLKEALASEAAGVVAAAVAAAVEAGEPGSCHWREGLLERRSSRELLLRRRKG